MLIKYKVLLLALAPLVFITLYHIYIYDMLINQVDIMRNSVIGPAIREVRSVTNMRYLTVESFHSIDDIMDRLELYGYNASLQENVTKGIQDTLGLLAQRDAELQNLNSSLVVHDPAEIPIFANITSLVNKSESQFGTIIGEMQSLPLTRENIVRIAEDEISMVGSSEKELTAAIVDFTNLHYDKLAETETLLGGLEQSSTNTLYYSSIASSVILLLIVVFINSYIVGPIEKITRDIDEISRGNLDVDIQDKSRDDEIGTLARSFDRMLVSIKIATGNSEEYKKERR